MQHLFPAKLLLRILFQGLFGPLHTEAMLFGFSREKDQEILANRSFNKVLSPFIARDKALRSRIHAKPQVYVGDQANQRSWSTHLKEEGRIFGIA